LVSGTVSGNVLIWNVESGQLVLTLRGAAGRVGCVTYSPDGRRVAAGTYDAYDGLVANAAVGVHVWDAQAGRPLHSFKLPPGVVRTVAFSADGRSLLAGGHFKQP